jgi:hypothetical protein
MHLRWVAERPLRRHAFVFEARPVIPIDDAVRVELESIAFCDGLKRK